MTTTTPPALLATDLMAWMGTLPRGDAYAVLPTPTETPQPVYPGWTVVNVLQTGMTFKVIARRGSVVSIAEKLTADQVMGWDPGSRFTR